MKTVDVYLVFKTILGVIASECWIEAPELEAICLIYGLAPQTKAMIMSGHCHHFWSDEAAVNMNV